jgi:DNA invertase Pin-like site-specific DNA recombinase
MARFGLCSLWYAASPTVGGHSLPDNSTTIQVAQYVRMSTEHQQYSIDNQAEAIGRYAAEHNMRIVRSYVDSGKSGLSFKNRPGLRQLIADVEGGSPGYATVLVYDVSRWGRFQDVDESAFYEYRCRQAKIAVHYCVESFPNDGSAWATLAKTLKRTMAAEYSRELSAKVFAGQSRLTELGFRQGGTAGYGFRRLLIDQNRTPKSVLQQGEEKSIATDRVVLTPGPGEEIAIVNEVFRMYVVERLGTPKIAQLLNERGIPGEGGRAWTRNIIRRMVTNPKYIGTNVTNRQSAKLQGRQVQNPSEMWVRRDNAFEGIVDPELYRRAVDEAQSRSTLQTNDELIERLRQCLKKNGKLSSRLMRKSLSMPCGQLFSARFGGLAEAYRLVGYQPPRSLLWVERDRAIKPIRRDFVMRVVDILTAAGASVEQDVRGQFLIINANLNMRLCISRCRTFKRFSSWKFPLVSPYMPDVSIFARLTTDNTGILDYFCVPTSKKSRVQITVSPQSPPPNDVQQFSDLAFIEDFANWGSQLRLRN